MAFQDIEWESVEWIDLAEDRDTWRAAVNTVMNNSRYPFHALVWNILKAKKCNSVPLQAWSGPEGSRKLRFPDFMTTAPEGGKVVSLTHRPPLPPGNPPVTHLC